MRSFILNRIIAYKKYGRTALKNPMGVVSLFVYAIVFVSVLVAGFAATAPTEAAVTKLINFQGKLTNNDASGTNVANGNYAIEFKMYTASSGGSAVWTETWDGSSGPCPELTVTNGVFNAKLGACNSLASVNFTGGSMYISVNVEGDGEMSPRKQIGATVYALVANGVNGDGTVQNTIQSATALTVARSGTDYALQVDTNTASSVTGLKVTSGISGGGLALSTISPATDEALTVNAKGAGTITIGTAGGSTGDILFGGGSGSTGCTVTNSTGAFACTAGGTFTGLTATGLSTAGVVINSSGGVLSTDTALDVATGGTNILSYTSGDVLYASGTTTLAKLGIGSTNQCLIVTAGLPSWGACASGGIPISSLTAATGTNSINNANFDQIWAWNTLSSGSALTLSSTSTAAASNTQTILNIATSGTNGTSAQTTYGAQIANTHAGTTSTNVALQLTASGGTTANYALLTNGGSVGIGTLTPAALLDVQGGTYTLGGSGDVSGNGTISAFDAIMVGSYLAGGTLTNAEYARADINGDGGVTKLDQDLIANIVVSTITVDQANRSVGKLKADRTISIDYNENVGIGNLSPVALLTLGTAGTKAGTLSLAGATTGTITIQPQAAAGTYNFNLPITAGTSGYVLTSDGGSSNPMTWTDPAALGVRWNSIAAPNGNASIAMGANTTAFTFNSATTGNIFALSSSSLTSGNLVDISVSNNGSISDQKALSVTTSGNHTGLKTTYAGYFNNNHTSGVSGYNIGLFAAASGGTNQNNFAAIFDTGFVGVNTRHPVGPLQVSPIQYSTGTASLSGTTITGSGTTFTSAMVGSLFTFADGTVRTITAFTNSTTLTASATGTVASQNYTINYPGFIVQNDSNVLIGSTTNPGTQSRLYVYGGANGANIDVRGNPNQLDTSVIELEGSDYDTNINSVRLQYYGVANPSGTIMGYNNQDLGVLAWQGAVTQTALIVTQSNSDLRIGTNNTERMAFLKTGNIGIGTTTPDSALEINSAGGTNLRLTYNDSNGSATNYADLLMGSSGALTIQPSGFIANLGGGSTETALRFLEASGNGSNYVAFKSAAALGGNVTWTLPSADSAGCFQSNGSGTVSLSACGDSISINGSATTDANFINTAASGTVAAVTLSLNTTPSPDEVSIVIGTASATEAGIVTTGTQIIAGAKTLTSDLTVTKADPALVLNVTTATDTDFWLGVQDDAGGDDDDFFQIGDGSSPGTNPFLTIDTSGKVGIGDPNPAALFTVGSGDLFQIASNGNLTSSNAGTWTISNDTNLVLSGGVNGLSFDSTTLSIDATNDRVGIGTAAPAATLDVNGTIYAANNGVGGPGYAFSAATTSGLGYVGSPGTGNTLLYSEGAVSLVLTHSLLNFRVPSNYQYSWSSATNNLSSSDTGLSRIGAAVVGVGNGTAGTSGGTLVAGNIGVSNTSPGALLHVGPNAGYGTTTGLLVANNLTGNTFDRAYQIAPVQTASPGTNSILMYVIPTINTSVTVPSQYGVFIDGKQGSGTATSYSGLTINQLGGGTNNTKILLGTATIPTGTFGIYSSNSSDVNYFAGNTGINNPSPDTTFEVTGGLCVSDATGDGCTTTSGDIRADGAITANAFDIAERYASTAALEPGTVVSVDPNKYLYVAQSTHETAVLGIISTDPGFVLGWEDNEVFAGAPHVAVVALAGRVPVKVTSENGSIRAGDFLTASDTVPGAAMKAAKAGPVLGQALTSYADAGIGKIMVFVKATNYNGAAIENEMPGLVFDYADIEQSAINSYDILAHLLDQLPDLDPNNLSQVNTDVVIAGGEVVTPTVTAHTLRTDLLTAATADGGLSVASSTVFNGGLKVDSIGSIGAILSIESDVEFFGTPYFTSDTAGFAVIKPGAQSVDVEFTHEYIAQPMVNATISFENDINFDLIDDPDDQEALKNAAISSTQAFLQDGISYAITNKTVKGFTIVLNKPAPSEVKFSWISLAVKNANTFTSIDAPENASASPPSGGSGGGGDGSPSGDQPPNDDSGSGDSGSGTTGSGDGDGDGSSADSDSGDSSIPPT